MKIGDYVIAISDDEFTGLIGVVAKIEKEPTDKNFEVFVTMDASSIGGVNDEWAFMRDELKVLSKKQVFIITAIGAKEFFKGAEKCTPAMPCRSILARQHAKKPYIRNLRFCPYCGERWYGTPTKTGWPE